MADDSVFFHPGERRLQASLGMRERVEKMGRHMIGRALSVEHQYFFARLPLVFLGFVDEAGQPWASALCGAPGFVDTADPAKMVFRGRLADDDPAAAGLRPGAACGVLGLDFLGRRRGRVSGVIEQLTADGFCLSVGQAYGNCPKYIHARACRRLRDPAEPLAGAVRRGRGPLSAEDAALVRAADTFFIASHFAGPGPGAGADISHRGGAPGFVHIAEDGALLFPDYVGNFLFNTLGNLVQDPRAGLLFIDFDKGDTLQISGQAQIIEEGADLARFAGARRLVRLRPGGWLRRTPALPYRWELRERSPHLP
jgi:predicted pyridoxine 5'-phosphate oxidase superfamily flavin-nucleotide-binding protein